MRRSFNQILNDLRHRRFIDLYATTLAALIFAALLVVGADLPESVRWSVLFAALAFLLLRVAMANHREDRFLDRSEYDRHPIREHLRKATDVWIFAPVGTNFLNEERCEILRQGPLARENGKVRIVVLKPFAATDPISEQLDALLDHPAQPAAESLQATYARLRVMQSWNTVGEFAFATITFNPGFSIVAVNPGSPGGFANVEFHGFRNDMISSRMHIHLTRDDGRWYMYWLEQFEAIWRSAADADTIYTGVTGPDATYRADEPT